MIVHLEAAMYNLIDRGLENEIKTWDGCYNVRPIRGREGLVNKFLQAGQTKKAMIYMSIHSWANAIDINAKTNGLGTGGDLSIGLVKSFEDAGWEWGGRWKRKDPMHFQLKF